ncbi:MAG: Oligopeptide transport ATP-binding protein OppF [Verrucomicrobia subdivision 3 bacterium]|nr:Oligopeptide transport ATP-binding protein OppF [Limisphaerales bacterium]MCS1412869.1 Oligopeptide transport ATP-binding protein OppF [Limisphaerales bacterium]
MNGAGFQVEAGETAGLVGESGWGKSLIAKSLVLLERPSGGQIFCLGGRTCSNRQSSNGRRVVNRRRWSFQDSCGSLNPKFTIGESIAEGIEFHGLLREPDDIRERVARLLGAVGLDAFVMNECYSREFNDGQRQRIGIRRALTVEPELVVCDESVSVLDVSVQAQMINLLHELQTDTGLPHLLYQA